MTTTALPAAAEYAAAMTSALTTVATTCGALGIRPCTLNVAHSSVGEMHHRPWRVSVQVDDRSDADRLAAHYGLPGDDDHSRVYIRVGLAVLDHIGEVTVSVYTGREVTR